MVRNFRSFALVSLILFFSGCQKLITPPLGDAFLRCQESSRKTEGFSSVRGKARLSWTDQERTLKLNASFLAKAPDQFYLEGEAFGFPSLIVAHRKRTFTLYSPSKGQAYVDRHAPTLDGLFGIPMTWETWTSTLLSRFQSVTWSAFYANCSPKEGKLPTGEKIELGKPKPSQVPSWIRVSWKEGSIRWDYRSYESNLSIPSPWFEVSMDPQTQFLDKPQLLR